MDMETTKHKLPHDINIFFNDLSKYLGTKLLFYGSIQRYDYFPGSSDIDVDIFTDNVDSTITRMQHFLHVKRSKFKKIVWQYSKNSRIIYGNKIGYKNEDINLICEFSIYDNKYKSDVIENHKVKTILPHHATILLWIIKKLFYDLKFLTDENYKYLKNFILSYMIGMPTENFQVLNVSENKY
jgi:hypothetical protein